MVSHFRNIQSHKREVLSLYKTLIRHAKFINHLDEISPDTRINLIQKIRFQFRKDKGQMSGHKTRVLLDEAYKIEEQLRVFHKTGDTEPITDLLFTKAPTNSINKRKGQTAKKPINEQSKQNLHLQREGSYIHQYIKYLHRAGLFPKQKNIDPEVLEQIIKPEALFKRAKLDILIAEQKVARGPYRIHEANTGPVRFLRMPGEQKQSITDMIRRQKALTELVSKLEVKTSEFKTWCVMETAWEKEMRKLDPKHEVNDWFGLIDGYTKSKQHQLNELNKYHSKFAADVLPELIEYEQTKSDEFHQHFKKKFVKMAIEAEGVTPHDDLLGKKTLPEIVRDHNLETR